MKPVFVLLGLFAAARVVAVPHPFDVHDLVMMDRASDPQISPDGKHVAYQLRETDYAANKGINGIWLIDASGKNAQRLTPKEVSATSPRWSPDGKYVYYLAQGKDDEVTRVWRVATDT